MKGIKFKKHNEDYYSRPLYEVGDLYITTKSENPSARFGGTWELYGPGRTLVCVDTSQTEFDVVKKSGGEKTHKLTTSEMPNHDHTQNVTGNGFSALNYINNSDNMPVAFGAATGGYAAAFVLNGTATGAAKVTNFASVYRNGGNQPHNNLQPFITCYVWIRTA